MAQALSVFIGIPAYDCKTHIGTTRSLANEAALAATIGLPLTISFQPGMSLVHSARNMLCHEFLTRTKCQKMVFVDADCGWEPGALIKLVTLPGEVVAGACRRRREPEDYALNWLPSHHERSHNVIKRIDGCLEAEAIGMAFTCISRGLLERFRDATPERSYTMDGERLHAFFDSPVRDGFLWGEDFSFCNKVRELGGSIWIDPSITLQHLDGLHTYEGNLANWLQRERQ